MVFLDSLGLDLAAVLLRVGIFALLYVMAYRRLVFSVFDPLNVFLISQICSSVIAATVVHDPRLLAQFFAAEVAFYLGFRMNRCERHRPVALVWSDGQMQVLEIGIAMLFAVWLLADMYVGATTGFPIFSENATLAKIATFRDGLGFVKRLNGGVGLLVPAGALVAAVAGKHRLAFAGVFTVSVFLSTLDGSKSAVLSFLFLIGYAMKKRGLVVPGLRKRLRIATALLSGLAVFVALYILVVDKGDWETALVSLFGRILFYGDVVLYYYQPDMMHYLGHFGPIDWVFSELNPILGEFRLAAYQEPLGITMVTHSLGNETLSTLLGPNTQFFVRGHIYFGYFFGTLYAAMVGWTVSRVRRWFFETEGTTPMGFVFALTMAVRIFTLPMESPYFNGLVFDTILPMLLVTTVLKIMQVASGTPPLAARSAEQATSNA